LDYNNSNTVSDNNRDIETLTTEFKMYSLERKLPLDGDPSKYWRENAKIYPRLSNSAKKFLTTLPTSAFSERVFSLSEEMISPKRSSLCPETAEMLVFLNKNSIAYPF